jgi:hypothetical protein
MLFKALADAGFPRNRVFRGAGCQGDAGFAPYDYSGIMMAYVDTAGLIEADATFGSLIDCVFSAMYTHVNVGDGPLYHARLTSLDWADLSDETIYDYFHNDHVRIATYIAGFNAGLETVTGRNLTSLPVFTYEWGHELQVTFSNTGGTFHEFTTGADNTMVWDLTAGWPPPGYDNGDDLRQENPPNGYPGICSTYLTPGVGTSQSPTPTYVRRVDGYRSRIYDTYEKAVATYGSDVDAQAASIPLDVANGVQPWSCGNLTRFEAFKVRIVEFFESEMGKTMYQDYYAHTIGPGKWLYPTQYHDYQYADGGTFQYWGTKKGVYDDDCPRFEWYRDLD